MCLQGSNAATVDVLTRVLQLLPSDDMVRSCALVNSTWRTAAAAVITSIKCEKKFSKDLAPVSDWLTAHRNTVVLEHLALSAIVDDGALLLVCCW